MRQHRVGEVVVFVDHDVHRHAALAAAQEQFVELARNGGMAKDVAHRRVVEQVAVAPQRIAQLPETVFLETLLQGLQLVVEGGEIEVHHQIAALVRGGFIADVRASKEGAATLSGLAPEYDVPNRIPVSRTSQ